MKILNTLNNYRDIYRHRTFIQLFKMLAEYTEERTDEEGKTYTAVTGRDWEAVSIPRTEDTELIYTGEGESQTVTDPVRENFDTYYAQGHTLEHDRERGMLMLRARTCRWDTMEVEVFDNGTFTNLGAERNALMLSQAIDRYRAGKPLTWVNLDGSHIPIDESNIGYLADLYSQISDRTQFSFDMLAEIIDIINATSDGELASLNIEAMWQDRWAA